MHVSLIYKNDHVNMLFEVSFFSLKPYMLVHKLAIIHEGQGETEKEADHSRLVDSSFHKQGNLQKGLSWMTAKE